MQQLLFRKTALVSILLIASNSIFAQTTPAPAPAAPAPAPSAAPTAIAAPATARPVASAPATTAAAPAAPVAPRPRPAAPKPAEAPVTVAPAGYTGPVWKKQVTRDIEMGDRIDTSLHKLRNASPDNTLLEMFAIGIKTGKISSFYTSDFSMTTRIKAADFDKLFVSKARKNFNYSDVHKYRVLEEWTSYPGIGKTEVRITGIAPLKDIVGDDGTTKAVDPLFWVHYTEDIKAIIARYDQYHPNNTLGGHIWADYFNAPSAQR